MAAPGSAEHWERVRSAARQAKDRTSLRKVAAEIGIGWSTLKNFLNGATPHARIGQKLTAWHAGLQPGSNELSPADAERYLSALLGPLAGKPRKAAEKRVRDAFREGFRRSEERRV